MLNKDNFEFWKKSLDIINKYGYKLRIEGLMLFFPAWEMEEEDSKILVDLGWVYYWTESGYYHA
jgi:hypothetical protein